jgi:hypothetical protein
LKPTPCSRLASRSVLYSVRAGRCARGSAAMSSTRLASRRSQAEEIPAGAAACRPSPQPQRASTL